MAETRAYLRAQALSCRSVGEILTQTNQALAEDIGEERYVTVLLARLDPARRTLAYVNAGHPSGYILNPQGDLKTELARTGPPLSPHSNKPFKESDPVVLEAGDLILLLTDGFEDAFAPGYAFFGAERALEVVRANRDRPASQVVDALYEAVSAFVQGAQPPDDLTAVVVKVLPG
jgi:sigma-B regulation protein RsbU (phosphoserine phosphatase)